MLCCKRFQVTSCEEISDELYFIRVYDIGRLLFSENCGSTLSRLFTLLMDGQTETRFNF